MRSERRRGDDDEGQAQSSQWHAAEEMSRWADSFMDALLGSFCRLLMGLPCGIRAEADGIFTMRQLVSMPTAVRPLRFDATVSEREKKSKGLI